MFYDEKSISGVVKHVGDALFAKSPKAKSDIVCIGFSPWGVIEGRENLVGINVREKYIWWYILNYEKNHVTLLESCFISFKSVSNKKQCNIK